MADEHDERKKPADLENSYYKMLQDLHQVDKRLQKNELDAYDLRHRMQETAEEMRLKREQEEAQANSGETAETKQNSEPKTDEELGGFAREYLLRRQKDKGESPFQNLQS